VIGVLNTRPRDQASALSVLLRQAGYQVYEVPLVELALLPEGLAALRSHATQDCDGLLLSSPNLIPQLASRANHGLRETLIGKPWYLISQRARAQAEAFGARVAFAPKVASLQGFLSELPQPKRELRLLHLCSEKTRLDVSDFAAKAVQVVNLPVYSPQCPPTASKELEALWPKLQAILFASGSAVQNFFRVVPALGKKLGTAQGPQPISIGPSSSEALTAHGIAIPCIAPTADNEGFLAALKKTFPSSSA